MENGTTVQNVQKQVRFHETSLMYLSYTSPIIHNSSFISPD